MVLIHEIIHGALLVYDIHDRESYDAAKALVVKLKAGVSVQCPPYFEVQKVICEIFSDMHRWFWD